MAFALDVSPARREWQQQAQRWRMLYAGQAPHLVIAMLQDLQTAHSTNAKPPATAPPPHLCLVSLPLSNDLSAFDVIWVSRSAPHTQLVVAVAGAGACVAGQAAVQAEGAQDVRGHVTSCAASAEEQHSICV